MRLIDVDFFQQKAAIKIISSNVLESNKKELFAKVFIHNTQGILMIVNDFIRFLCLGAFSLSKYHENRLVKTKKFDSITLPNPQTVVNAFTTLSI